MKMINLANNKPGLLLKDYRLFVDSYLQNLSLVLCLMVDNHNSFSSYYNKSLIGNLRICGRYLEREYDSMIK